jgi:hypothetical protein
MHVKWYSIYQEIHDHQACNIPYKHYISYGNPNSIPPSPLFPFQSYQIFMSPTITLTTLSSKKIKIGEQ